MVKLPPIEVWENDSTPSEPGWYSLLLSWGQRETVRTAAYFDGAAWDGLDERAFCYRSPMAFPTQEEAEDWGIDHDPGW